MRRSLLLSVLLTMPGLVMAQPSQTDSKPPSKPRSPPSESDETRGSALDRARAVQQDASDADRIVTDEAEDTPVSEEAAADEPDGPKLPLAAKMFLTHNPAGFTKAWKAGGDSLPTTKSISQANPVVVLVTVSGCTRGKDGKCAVEFTSRTAGPDGLFDKPRTSPPWKPAPMGNKPELAPASFGLRLGPGDPPGRYTIEVKVTDMVAKTSRTLTGTVIKPAAEGGR